MSYRRKRDEALAWWQWVDQYRPRLLSCGIPPVLFDSQRHWWYFIEYGYFAPDGQASVIDVHKMPADQAMKLCEVLETLEEDEQHKSVALNRLQFHLKRGAHAVPSEAFQRVDEASRKGRSRPNQGFAR
jgi:hypothetical protein